jgi:hypothetical protein
LSISGNILKEKAAQFWPKLYPGIDSPKFSNGWLEGFKARHLIKSCKKYGEAADVNLKANTKAIYNVRVRTSEYPLSDIVTWVGIASVTGITSAVHDRQYHYLRILSSPVSVLSDSYIPGTTMCI